MARRIVTTALLFASLLALIALRLGVVFLSHGPSLASRAAVQHAQRLPLDLPRGAILDRDGVPFTGSSLQENLVAFPSLIPPERRAAVALSVGRATGLPASEVLERLSSGYPVVLVQRMSPVAQAAVARLGVVGVMTVRQRLRYQEASPAAHVIGYVRLADNEGVAGIESSFNSTLREGQGHTLAAMVDAGKNLIPGLGFKITGSERQQGLASVTLTLSEGIQNRLELAMAGVSKGAAVGMDPRTGDILAMVSKPSYDQSDVAPALEASDNPLIDRALMGYYPGSLFKLVTAAAALDSGLVDPREVFHCPGYIEVGATRRVRCSRLSGHGDIDFLEAISKSCNTVFVEVALRVGAARIVTMAERLGLGVRKDIGLPGEETGHLPVPTTCTLGDVANMALGQKGVKVTPLQAASLVSTIVNDGAYVSARLVLSVTDGDGRKSPDYPRRAAVVQAMSPQAARNIRYAMEKAVEEGTGQEAQGVWGGSAGKTGTAETGRRDALGQPLSHAWFVGYAPKLEPTIVVAIVVQDGGAGGAVAAPIFRDFVNSLNGAAD